MTIEVAAGLTYKKLQIMIANWLNRSDIDQELLKDFISLAERKIFRSLRSPINEMLWIPPDRVEETSYLTLPGDLLEIKDLDIDGVDYRFKPYNIWITKKECKTYTRLLNNLYIRPNISKTAKVKLSYYWDGSGMNADDDTNNVLRTCPDLYLYAALIQAESFLINDERIPLWKNQYDVTLDELNRGLKNLEYRGNLVMFER